MIQYQSVLQDHFTKNNSFGIPSNSCYFLSRQLGEPQQKSRLYQRFDVSIRLKEKGPAYVLGEKVLKPIVDLSLIGIEKIKNLGEIIDKTVSRIMQIFPSAKACEIEKRKGKKFSLFEFFIVKAEIALFRSRMENSLLFQTGLDDHFPF